MRTCRWIAVLGGLVCAGVAMAAPMDGARQVNSESATAVTTATSDTETKNALPSTVLPRGTASVGSEISADISGTVSSEVPSASSTQAGVSAELTGADVGVGLSVVQPILALLAVFGLMFGIAWILKKGRLLPAAPRDIVKLIGCLALGNKAYIAVIEVGGQCLVVGVTPQQMTLLHTLPKQSLPADQAVTTEDHAFKSWLETTVRRFNR